MLHEHALAQVKQASRVPTGFSGTWQNELGSTMTIAVSGTQVTGTYDSAVSGGGGPAKGDLAGYVNGSLISFVVEWQVAAITAWVGHLVVENGNAAIETLWQMTTSTNNPEDPKELWDAVFAGADRFVRV